MNLEDVNSCSAPYFGLDYDKPLASAAHVECLEWKQDHLPDTSAQRHKYRCAPGPRQIEERFLWVKTVQLSILHQALRTVFPNEIINNIAEHSSHKHLALMLLTRRQNVPQRYEILTTEDIWCSFVDFEGICYVKALSNCACTDAKRIFTPVLLEHHDFFYVSQDHQGILEVVFASNPPKVDRIPGVWWTVHSVRDTPVEVQFDVRMESPHRENVLTRKQGYYDQPFANPV